ncbi:MAG: isochorismatase family cysteine hydrolase [Alphaproteobacteria bacterium]|jgi:ureidoacrylate peracid hydrolase|nr:isochorismatase family cysteine hydrolase [Alphaproteobacteria bacterium]
MHDFEIPQAYVDRVTTRQGRPHLVENLQAARTALLVVDMQNYYMAEGQQAACAMAREIVPRVNRLAAAMRAAGGLVVWLQNRAPWGSLESWSVAGDLFLPEKRELRWQSLQEDAFGFALWPEMEVHDADARVVKERFSAFIQGSSNLQALLGERGIDTALVAGVYTNVCCDSTARDAMMLNFRTLMVSDGCAASTDAEHGAALCNFYLTFGDVQTSDEVIALLDAS